MSAQLGDPKEIGAAINWAIKVAEIAQKFIEGRESKKGEFYDRLEEAMKEGR